MDSEGGGQMASHGANPAHPARVRPGRVHVFWTLWLLGSAAAGALIIAAWRWPYFPGDVPAARLVQTADPLLLDAPFRVLNTAGSGIPALGIAAVVASVFLVVRRIDLLVIFLSLNALRPASGLLKWLTDPGRRRTWFGCPETTPAPRVSRAGTS